MFTNVILPLLLHACTYSWWVAHHVQRIRYNIHFTPNNFNKCSLTTSPWSILLNSSHSTAAYLPPTCRPGVLSQVPRWNSPSVHSRHLWLWKLREPGMSTVEQRGEWEWGKKTCPLPCPLPPRSLSLVSILPVEASKMTAKNVKRKNLSDASHTKNVCSAGKMRCITTHSHEHILHFANTFASGLVRSDAHAIGLPQGSPPGRYAGEYKGIEWGFAPGQAKIQDHGRQPRGCHGNIFYWEISDQRTLSHTNYPSPGEIVNFARCILQSPGGRLGCQPLTRESEPVLLPEIYWGGTPGSNEDWTR